MPTGARNGDLCKPALLGKLGVFGRGETGGEATPEGTVVSAKVEFQQTGFHSRDVESRCFSAASLARLGMEMCNCRVARASPRRDAGAAKRCQQRR